MATKTAAVPQPDAPDAREDGPDAPLLDTLGAELKKLVQKGKERGYVTYDELNAALPPDEVSSEQIEDTMAMLSEAGVNVVEAEEQEDAPAAGPAEPAKTAVVAAGLSSCSSASITLTPASDSIAMVSSICSEDTSSGGRAAFSSS